MANPFYIQWHITQLCNLRCQHCYQNDFSREGDLDWEGLRRVADNLLATLEEWGQTACIHLTGGEPLLKGEWFPLFEYLDRHPLIEELGLITNGLLLTPETVEKLSAFPKLKKVKISLDGADAETNDSIRGKGMFGKVIQNLPLIKQRKRFEVLLMFTVMKRNFRELRSFFRLSKDLGVSGFIMERFIPWGRGSERRHEVLTQEDWKEVMGMLLDLFLIEEENLLLPHQAFQVIFDGEEPELLGAPCVIGKEGLCVMSNGDVFPCRRLPISIGNLLQTPLKKIWKESDLLAVLRRKESLKGKCGTCPMEDCRGCRSLAFALTHDYLAEDPHCFAI